MEGSFGKLREQWEKAHLKRKYDVCNGRSAMGDQADASRFHTDTHHHVEVENTPEQCTKTPTCSSSSNCRHDKENPSPFIATGDSNLGSTSYNPMKTPFSDINLKATEKTQFSHSKADVQDRGESFTPGPPLNHAEQKTQKPVEHGGSSFCKEEERSFTQEKGNKQINHAKKNSQDKEITPPVELCLSNSEPSVDINFGHSKASFPDEEASLCKNLHSVETMVDHGRVQQTPLCNSHFPKESKEENNSSVDKEKSLSGVPSFWNTQPSDETQVNHGVAPDDEVGTVPDEGCQEKGKSVPEEGCQEKGKSVPEEPSFCNIQCNEAQIEQRKSCLVETKEIFIEPMSTSQQLDERDNQLDAQDGDVMHTVESCIINEREKLKETDEYKQAVEEEWASRQRELQIQAEEAQQLRRLQKRRKAESMRLLDMERRQKQRVEEMRETQKKDEENMNLKEQLRAEVRKELIKLEMMCHDMASLLRGLGIHVSGGLHPLPHEVRAAYKRALLGFHPDRASRSDIRELVEAEEKFKLISSMKDKFFGLRET
uniref:Putative caldesmon n=1 Tax=Davidia involucrata TaxID=16924 RepID=A0A5B7A927_DAVIN